MINGLLIGLREGVEASLVVGIVVAYLVRTGNRQHLPRVWAGTLGAVAASVLLGLVLYVTVGDLRAPYEQMFEGATMLLATAVVTWMLFWMRGQSRALRGNLEAQLARALTSGGAWGLAVLAFSAVIREGIETSLFVFGQVTAVAGAGTTGAGATGGAAGVLAGTIVGLVVAAGIGYAIYRGSRRVNLRVFFNWTGIALVFIAAGLVSRAVHEFVEVGAIRIGTQTAFDARGILSQDQTVGSFLRAVLGYSSQPEVVTVVVYLLYVGAVLALYTLPQRQARPVQPQAA